MSDLSPNDPKQALVATPTFGQTLWTLVQYVLPHHAISRLVYRVSRWRTPFTAGLIRRFVRYFGVNLAEAAEPDPTAYPTFNAFFTRALREDARPLPEDPACWVSPCDGVLSQFGLAQSGNLIQAKGRDYTIAQLLGGDAALAETFAHSQYATIYLSPKDYHRVHMPLAGRLRRMIHVPGRLFSVSLATVQQVPELLARNERLVCIFDTAQGPMALVLVGAINVAAIETVWAGVVTPPAGQGITTREYGADIGMLIDFSRGQEMGRFNLGSTVVALLPTGCGFEPTLHPGAVVKMGQGLGGCAPREAE